MTIEDIYPLDPLEQITLEMNKGEDRDPKYILIQLTVLRF